MRSFAAFTRVCSWVLLVFTGMVQLLAAVGIFVNGSQEVFNPWWLIAATALMVLSVVLFFALRRGKTLALLIALADAVLFVVLAFMLKNAFPVVLAVDGSDTGISLWMAIWRHMSPVLVPLCLLPTWVQYHEDRVAEKNATSEQNTPSYLDLIDENYTMRPLDEDDAKEPKAKRSVRIRLRKTEASHDSSDNI